MVSILFHIMISAVAALSTPSGRKVVPSVMLVVGAEGTLLAPALVPGEEAVRCYRRFLDPRTWFGRSGRS